MNILFTFNTPLVPSYGGIQRVTNTLALELQRQGHNVYYLCYEKTERLNNSNLSIETFIIDLKKDIKNQIEEIINKNHIEYVINQKLNENMFNIIANVPSHVKIVSTCHVQPFHMDGITRKRIWNNKAKNWRQLLMKGLYLVSPKIEERIASNFEIQQYSRALQVSDRLCFISERFYPRIKKHWKSVDWDRITAVNNPNTFKSQKAEYKKENLILFVGRIENAQKNNIGFIKMWEIFSRNNPDWKAQVLGEGPDLKDNIRYVERHNIERIEFLGRQNSVEDYYKRAKYVCVTSYGESWCLVLTEAMNFQCIPIVYDTYETLHDIIDDGENGYIVDPSPKCMANKLNSICKDEPNRILIASKCEEQIALFEVVNIAKKWIAMLNNIK